MAYMPSKQFKSNVQHPIIGNNDVMQEIKAYLLKIAATDSTVLITGETGTGKELAAELIHHKSARHRKRIVSINCAAIPEGLFESELFGYERGAFTGANSTYEGKLKLAEGGTIFFDEIGDLSPSVQAKILRVMENKEFYRIGGRESISMDVRFIAATNQNLEGLIDEGKFRSDLFFRLAVAWVHLPPLRERKDDIITLINYYINDLYPRFGHKIEGLTDDVYLALLNYDWPGNIRELKNILEATFITQTSSKIDFADLPKIFQTRLKNTKKFPKSEKDQVLSALLATNWNKSKAAQKLEWSRMTLYRKMIKHNITQSSSSKKLYH